MKRLKLNKDQATIGGVCVGLGDYFDTDPTLIKLLFVAGFFIPYVPAVFTYIILLIVVPND
jgi:phage shock protein PspC (stress-responsive transcriptional regulator)